MLLTPSGITLGNTIVIDPFTAIKAAHSVAHDLTMERCLRFKNSLTM